jgi:hypothetical protein
MVKSSGSTLDMTAPDFLVFVMQYALLVSPFATAMLAMALALSLAPLSARASSSDITMLQVPSIDGVPSLPPGIYSAGSLAQTSATHVLFVVGGRECRTAGTLTPVAQKSSRLAVAAASAAENSQGSRPRASRAPSCRTAFSAIYTGIIKVWTSAIFGGGFFQVSTASSKREISGNQIYSDKSNQIKAKINFNFNNPTHTNTGKSSNIKNPVGGDNVTRQQLSSQWVTSLHWSQHAGNAAIINAAVVARGRLGDVGDDCQLGRDLAAESLSRLAADLAERTQLILKIA